MAKDTVVKTKTIIGLIISALTLLALAGSAAVQWNDITVNTKTNEKQDTEIKKVSVEVIELKGDFKLQDQRLDTFQKNMEVLQRQANEGIKEGNRRYIEIIKKLSE